MGARPVNGGLGGAGGQRDIVGQTTWHDCTVVGGQSADLTQMVEVGCRWGTYDLAVAPILHDNQDHVLVSGGRIGTDPTRTSDRWSQQWRMRWRMMNPAAGQGDYRKQPGHGHKQAKAWNPASDSPSAVEIQAAHLHTDQRTTGAVTEPNVSSATSVEEGLDPLVRTPDSYRPWPPL